MQVNEIYLPTLMKIDTMVEIYHVEERWSIYSRNVEKLKTRTAG